MTAIFGLPAHVLTTVISEWIDAPTLCRLDIACTNHAIRPRYLECIRHINLSSFPCRKNGGRSFHTFQSIYKGVFIVQVLDWLYSRLLVPNCRRIPLCVYLKDLTEGSSIRRKYEEGNFYQNTVNLLVVADMTSLLALHLTVLFAIFPRIGHLHIEIYNIGNKQLSIFLGLMISYYSKLQPSLESLTLTISCRDGSAEDSNDAQLASDINEFFSIYGNYIHYFCGLHKQCTVPFILENCPNIQVLSMEGQSDSGCWEAFDTIAKLKDIRTLAFIPTDKLRYFPNLEKCSLYHLKFKVDDMSHLSFCWSVLQVCKNIKQFECPSLNLDIHDGFSFLRLIDCSQYNDSCLASLLGILFIIPQIHTLSFDYIKKDEFYSTFNTLSLSPHLQHIKAIAADFHFNCSVPLLRHIVQNCPGIDNIVLRQTFRWKKYTIKGEDRISGNETNHRPHFSQVFFDRNSLRRSENIDMTLIEVLSILHPIYSIQFEVSYQAILDALSQISQQDDSFTTTLKEIKVGSLFFSLEAYQNLIRLFQYTLQAYKHLQTFDIPDFIRWDKEKAIDNDITGKTSDYYSTLSFGRNFTFEIDDKSIQTFIDVLSLIPPTTSVTFNFEKASSTKLCAVVCSALQCKGHAVNVTHIYTKPLDEVTLQIIIPFFPALKVLKTIKCPIDEE